MNFIAHSFACPLCGQRHRAVVLRPGQRASCARCGTVLAQRSRWGSGVTLAFAFAGLVLFAPAVLLPFVTLRKFGNEHASFLFRSVEGLWQYDMPALAAWVFFCGVVAPVLLLGLLIVAVMFGKGGEGVHRPQRLERMARAVQYWAMPEVQVLAVLISFSKLGDVVGVRVEPGLWFFGAASLAMLLAWHSFSFAPDVGSGHFNVAGAKS